MPTIHDDEQEQARDAEKELEAQLDKKRAELATLQAGREKSKRLAELQAELAETERKCQEEAALAEAESKFGPLGKKLAALDTVDGLVIVKQHDGVKVRLWADKNGEKPSVQACRELVRPCVVHPALERFDEMVKDRPLLLVTAAGKVLELAGIGAKEVSGK
ncbi:hypothetical protein WMF20_35385 [Sorangium sp. So ce834]|jgi:hypothetical protein|uniref:hypothetical protein n=1 Tax=Sorangium sp. So ce834 TaxID=3133321 RepID=UPI003F62218A